MHIALLDVDVPVPSAYSARGLYSSQFRNLLHAAASRLNIPASRINTTAFDVVGGSLPPLQSLRKSSRAARDGIDTTNPLARPIDGILITGAAAASYEHAKHPWIPPLQSFIQTVFKEYPHVRMFGSCFGHQIIAQALLSSHVTVEACPRGPEMGLTPIALNPDFARRFPSLSSSTALPVPSEMRLQMIHGDWVSLLPDKNLPEPWVNVGSTELCPLQGLYFPGRVLTFQGHFEFDVFVNAETCREFGRRNGWDRGDVERYLGLIEAGEDEDDARAAAEAVLLFYNTLDL